MDKYEMETSSIMKAWKQQVCMCYTEPEMQLSSPAISVVVCVDLAAFVDVAVYVVGFSQAFCAAPDAATRQSDLSSDHCWSSYSVLTWLFGVTGNCAACSKLIPAFEMVMRAKENVYHLDCFACQLCNQRFCVGDKFFLKNNMILCQTDYEDGLMKEGYAPQVR
ncbi:LIM homeobox transcription factor 1-beta-like [Micropterus dolomieu]|uniref:LIM homeobox transcription factor 1-beta-like n=1 Tax=Micropterus dolomieu TaxID=147949 RepID=UPI001E8E12E0|nr:LIM homeobox transcription factor 1-beta-like [Micropterus dolomieu]